MPRKPHFVFDNQDAHTCEQIFKPSPQASDAPSNTSDEQVLKSNGGVTFICLGNARNCICHPTATGTDFGGSHKNLSEVGADCRAARLLGAPSGRALPAGVASAWKTQLDSPLIHAN
jgi:hypothetical protein